MGIIDRHIIKGLLANYLIAIGVMISLYIVLDLFFNMDEFTESVSGTTDVMLDIVSFYGARVFLYFAQLSGVITLFACLITLARMRQQRELIAVLASGVSLYRVAAPVMAFGLATTAMWYVDTELIIPSIAHKLARRHDDARGLKTYGVWFLQDRDDALLSAQQYVPGEGTIKRLLVIKRNETGHLSSIIEAERATWEPSTDNSEFLGTWKLERGTEKTRIEETGDSLAPQGDFVSSLIASYPSNLDPKTIEMRQSTGWIRYLSSMQLKELANRAEGYTLEQIQDARHSRFTTPIVSLIMLALGLPFVLDRIPAGVVAAGSKSLLVCGSCFLVAFVSQSIGSPTHLSALPAWLPVIIFAPITAVLFDRIRT